MTDKQRALEALEALDEIGAAGCIFELGKHIETIRAAIIAAATRPMPEVVQVEEQEIADIISKSFSSKVSSETCEAAAHNLSVFFPNGLIIKGDEK